MLLTILIFIVILGLLVFVHELGHFLVAKRNGVRVDEFGFGFPPRIFGIQKIKKSKQEIAIVTEEHGISLISETYSSKTDKELIKMEIQESQTIIKPLPFKKWRFFWRNGKRDENFGEQTVYSINAIPLGGFVKIYGEEGEGVNSSRSFASKKAGQKAKILFAGVTMNFILAVFLFSLGNIIGLPTAIDDSQVDKYPGAKLQIVGTSRNSPAEAAGLRAGNFVIALKNKEGKVLEGIKRTAEFQAFVDSEKGKEIILVVERGSSNIEVSVVPRTNPPQGQGPLGVELATVANISLPWYKALWEGFLTTINLIWLLLVVIFQVLKNLIIQGKAGVDIVGPVGIYTLTNQAAGMGFIYLLQLTAILSINLAVINAFPFPALDGGRVLFLMIEKIKGSPVSQKVQNLAHSIGFALLILLMIAITYRDIVRFF
ncbi:MAG: hypothetical protein AUJ32_02715 [Parcubacteria group bacterium CG1_02_40_82]|uniref:Peptidase M50 domain-containing protein n=4 Tax=Candidatus Portnoyibacteriota TaxID=1817913 RepID=A0A2M7IIW5_9BACT|nr:MAG: hypothetical protein AUJ32_02715 [Parcubacteria group bacterium CG1_02_40_82]PIQ75055.1 MAG: hypothetical protein COV84_03105 [Candidatus Portnoybacteria bacterium CG11_big_fil_rev_8_21_14_0_20_40_15]PIS31938.1 MAG: hypothetical protein COT41_00305 [Candidatus Portnoybacteria bacterium CG08_land_8_20_14_0_20_40_83]PIW76473.1 MAG: hypothetical protein CO001_01080 [Candidatus Portnoybacteria bacterium CG_4_8_14_3_um_filter_40_10]PIY74956.1 MAG: hypothetical protein COY85_01760 [Candidatus